jgi:hypothetical protein
MSPRKPRTPKVRPPSPDAIDTAWRLFLAVPVGQEVQHLVAHEIATLGEEGWPVRWAQPETSHLTLHFLGRDGAGARGAGPPGAATGDWRS